MRKKEREKPIFQLVLLILGLVIISIFLMRGLYARYTSQARGSDQARVAKFEITSEQMEFTDHITAQLAPGESQEYKIKIKNNSEVSVNCKISLENKTLNLHDGSKELLGYQMTGAEQGGDNNSWYIELSPGASTDELKLNISLEDKIDPVFMGQIDAIDLKVYCEQID